MSEARYQTGSALFDAWRDDLMSGMPPVLYPVGTGELSRIEVGPGRVTLIGGAPGGGKSALVMQWVLDALRLTPDLRAIVCSVELPPSVLFDRQLARIADIDLTPILRRQLGAEHSERLERGMFTLERLAERIAFVRPPFDLANVAASSDAFEAGLLVMDYIQRIGPPGERADRRGAVDATMDYLRQFADAGAALIVVAALARSKDAKGRSTYSEGLSLASFRETSELEYGADDAFILAPEDGEEQDGPTWRVVLKHLKSRHGETRDIRLTFDRPRQRFTPANPAGPGERADAGKLQLALQSLWNRTKPAHDGEGDDE